MSKKPVDLGGLVTVDDGRTTTDPSLTLAPRAALPAAPRTRRAAAATKLRKVGFLVHPTALRQFNVLKAERTDDDRKNAGVHLIHEALELLFQKYGKPSVRLDI